MRFLKQFFQFYIFSNIHVALGTFCLVKLTLLSYGITENSTALFVFFSTIVSYNFIRFYRISDIVNWYSQWLETNKKELFFLVTFCIVGCVYLMFQFQLKAFLWLIPFALGTIFYGVPLPSKNEPLRVFPGIKLFLIAFAFAGVTVLFPLVQNDMKIGINEWVFFLQRFLFIVLITIPFDIRDLHCDKLSLKTLPQVLGVRNAKIVGVIFGLLMLALEFFMQPNNNENLIIVSIVIIISFLLLIFSKEKQSKYYAAFWVEALPIFWFLLIFFRLNQ